VWPMLHVDDTSIGTYEFGSVEGADLPIFLGNVTATRPLAFTETPTVLLADGTPLAPTSTLMIPGISTSDQVFEGNIDPNVNFVVDNVTSVGPGFVDVHADAGGHPSGSLGHAPVLDGTNTNVIVPLSPMIGLPVTPTVWPMLHADTDGNGLYEYLMIPGVDLPVVYNGAVVATSATISGSVIDPVAPTVDVSLTPALTVTTTVTTEGTADVTAEPTEEATSDATDEATAEPTEEVTGEPTEEATADVTAEPTAEETAAP
jgi:hypothetical protein